MAKIIGNTTATPNPRPDWNQTDASKADYIKNKPDVSNGFKNIVSGGSSIILEDISPVTHEFSCQLQLKEGETAAYEGVQVYCSGYNIWDEQWEVGSFSNTGEPVDATSGIRSKNFIRIMPNFQYVTTSAIQYVYYYDENMNFISRISRLTGSFTTPDSAYYIKFVTRTNYGDTYKNNIYISAYDKNISSKYVPYVGNSVVISDSEGFVNGLISYGELTTLITDNRFNITNCSYNKDINKIIDQTFDPTSTNAQSGAAVAEIIGNAPTNLNTLSKISNAIDNNPSFSKNVSNAAKNTIYGFGTIEVSDASPFSHTANIDTYVGYDLSDYVITSDSCYANEDGTISINFDGGQGSYLDIARVDDLPQDGGQYFVHIEASGVDSSECEYSFIQIDDSYNTMPLQNSELHHGDVTVDCPYTTNDSTILVRLLVIGKISLVLKCELICVDLYEISVIHSDGSAELVTEYPASGRNSFTFNTKSKNFTINCDKQLQVSCTYNQDINSKINDITGDIDSLEADFGSALDEIIELQEYLINGGDTALLDDAEGVGF